MDACCCPEARGSEGNECRGLLSEREACRRSGGRREESPCHFLQHDVTDAINNAHAKSMRTTCSPRFPLRFSYIFVLKPALFIQISNFKFHYRRPRSSSV